MEYAQEAEQFRAACAAELATPLNVPPAALLVGTSGAVPAGDVPFRLDVVVLADGTVAPSTGSPSADALKAAVQRAADAAGARVTRGRYMGTCVFAKEANESFILDKE